MFGFGVLIDCHSMPGNIRVSGSGHPARISSSATATAPVGSPTVALALQALEDLGFAAVRNKPYAGGFITEHYGRPARGCMPCRSRSTGLYIDETTLEKRRRISDALAQAIASSRASWSNGRIRRRLCHDRALAAE